MIFSDYQTSERMAAKLAAIPLPDLQGKAVLDVGCDFGWWSALAAERGAAAIVGIDRGREVRRAGFVDVAAECTRLQIPRATFRRIHLGKQWPAIGRFDVIFYFSLYHHVYQAAGGDHEPVWFWLWQHLAPGGELLWENPLSIQDPVVAADVQAEYHAAYTPESILRAADRYFTAQYLGPAGHVPTREVYRFRARPMRIDALAADVVSGAGGARRAFGYAENRRVGEIESVLGFRPYPGSLNLQAVRDFDWDVAYLRARLLDVVDRRAGLESPWAPRWARLYPVQVDGLAAWAFRFEGESYPRSFLECIASGRLRDALRRREVVLCRQRPTQ